LKNTKKLEAVEKDYLNFTEKSHEACKEVVLSEVYDDFMT